MNRNNSLQGCDTVDSVYLKVIYEADLPSATTALAKMYKTYRSHVMLLLILMYRLPSDSGYAEL